jgi:hypothetical protein
MSVFVPNPFPQAYRRVYCAQSVYFHFGGFLIAAADWGSETEFTVYERTQLTGDHFTITRHEGKWWGEIRSRHPEHLNHLPSGTKERADAVLGWFAFRDRMEQVILRDAGLIETI